MVRILVLLAFGLCRVVHAEPARDTLGVTGEAVGGITVWLGGSLNFEHRFEDSHLGLVIRGGAATGVVFGSDDGGEFARFKATAGLRRHWDVGYVGVEAGWVGVRHPRYNDGDDVTGIRWDSIPDLELEAGFQVDPVDFGIFVAPLGFGVRLGFAFDL